MPLRATSSIPHFQYLNSVQCRPFQQLIARNKKAKAVSAWISQIGTNAADKYIVFAAGFIGQASPG